MEQKIHPKAQILDILEHFGIESQICKLLEEIKELQEAKEEENIDHIIEEMADVSIVFFQIYYYVSELIDNTGSSLNSTLPNEKIYDKLNKVIDYKISRTLDRISSGFYKERSLKQ